MAKDHRPYKKLPYVHTNEGTFEVGDPPSSNKSPCQPKRPSHKVKEEWTEADAKKWREYWDQVDSEFDAWEMHYKRQQWNIKGGGG